MHFAIQREVLVQCLKEVSNALAGRSVQPILSHICITSVDQTTILFKATDLDLFIQSKANAVVYTPGSIALPGKKLLEVVSKLPDDLVSFQSNKETMETSIQCGRSKISFAGMAAEDYPNIGEIAGEGILIPADVMRLSVTQTSFAAAGFDTGSVIGGMFLSINNAEFECVATDGNRLAYRHELLSISAPGKSAKKSAAKEVSGSGASSVATMEKTLSLSLKAIIPARACSEILMIIDAQNARAKRTGSNGAGNSTDGDDHSSIGEIRLSINNGVISFQTESNSLSTRMISGEYPAFKELFPTQCKYMAVFDRQELITALDRVAVMADEKKHLIRLHFEGDTMQITANTPDFGRAQDEVSMKFEGQVLDIAVNVRYLLDVLRGVNSAEIKLEMTGSLQPMIVKEKESENYKYLLMPVELKMA